jgi:hypothetical protein
LTNSVIPQPAPPTVPVFPPPPPPLDSIKFPLGWLLDHASAPIQYRAYSEVARYPVEPGSPLSILPYTFAPAMRLSVAQAADGVWSGAMLTVPPQRGGEFENVGTVHAIRRLLEYGWDKDSPPVYHARRVLFRLLAEDNDSALLFEMAPPASKKPDPAAVLNARHVLREAAAATLAQCGFEADPRLRGAANRILERIFGFLRSPIAEKPWVRVGNKQVLAAEAYPPTVRGDGSAVPVAHPPAAATGCGATGRQTPCAGAPVCAG